MRQRAEDNANPRNPHWLDRPRWHVVAVRPPSLIGERLFGGGQDVVAGLLGAILRQGLGLFGKPRRVQYGGVVLVAEIAAQPKQKRAAVVGRGFLPELVAGHRRKVDRRQRRFLCVRPMKRAYQKDEA